MILEMLRTNHVDLLRYLPKFLANDPNFKDVQDTLSWEHERYRLKVMDILAQFFVDTATWGLADWERVYDLKSAPGDSYELRRERIKVKMRGVGTSTLAVMTNMVNAFVATKDAVFHENVEPGVFRIDMPMYVEYMDQVIKMLEIYKPAHLTCIIAMISAHDLVIGTKFGWVCYTSRISGTYPRRQTLGKLTGHDIVVETDKGGLPYRNPYTGEIPAGVYPVRATHGELADEAIDVETRKGGIPYRDPYTGEVTAGVFPETAQQGVLSDGDIVIATGSVSDEGGITASTSAGEISYSTRYCGRVPGSFM